MTEERPIRVLHVVSEMTHGGVESWLMHVLHRMDPRRVVMDFLVTRTDRPHPHVQEIHAAGGQIIPCALEPSFSFANRLHRILREHGPYDVVHSHAYHFSGLVLRVARQAGVPLRIAHSHMETLKEDAAAGMLRKAYLSLMGSWIRGNATAGLAASRLAATSLFGPRWETDPRWHMLYCGVDLAPFQTAYDAAAVRAEFGIPADALVIGHVGRFAHQKNHHFLLEVFAEIADRIPEARLLLVGEGPLRAEIEQLIEERGLSTQVIFTGPRSDVPRLMLGAMDLFLFPSHAEGLGLVLIEAQAAGLPCIISDVIPEEADVVPSLVRRMSLAQPAGAWADTALAARDTARYIPRQDALALVKRSPFAIETSVKALEQIYAA